MTTLLIPVASLSKTKSRLGDIFTRDQLKNLTIAMVKDLFSKITRTRLQIDSLVYCNSSEILDLAEDYGFIPIKEKIETPQKCFDDILQDINKIAIQEFNAKKTIITFSDLILITPKNLIEIVNLVEKNQVVVCPAIISAGISVLGRNPPGIIPTYFCHPTIPSLVALLNEANSCGLKIAIYDSFRAGFDIDIKHDVVLAHEYLKAFNLVESETYRFLEQNIKLAITKKSSLNNRLLEIKRVGKPNC
jgi:2-phospho-L-lactate guanylyltransferase (CobY/MobA/RfbA family)